METETAKPFKKKKFCYWGTRRAVQVAEPHVSPNFFSSDKEEEETMTNKRGPSAWLQQFLFHRDVRHSLSSTENGRRQEGWETEKKKTGRGRADVSARETKPKLFLWRTRTVAWCLWCLLHWNLHIADSRRLPIHQPFVMGFNGQTAAAGLIFRRKNTNFSLLFSFFLWLGKGKKFSQW